MVTFSLGLLCAVAGANLDLELVEFFSSGCSQCIAMESTLERLREDGFIIRKWNGPETPRRCQEYGVRRFPTLLLMVGGREIDRWEGAAGYERLREWLAGHSEVTGTVLSRREPALPSRSPFADRNAPKSRSASHRDDERDQQRPRDPFAGRDSGESSKGEPAGERRQSTRQKSATRPQRDATAGQPLPSGKPSANAIDNALAATVRIRITDSKGVSKGSGTVIDQHGDEALIMTCAHIFRDALDGTRLNGDVAIDLFSIPGTTATVNGQLLGLDLSRDIALVTCRPSQPVAIVRVALAADKFQVGDAVYSIGCDRGSQPQLFPSRITSIGRYQGPPNLSASGEPQIGRSGGGLFNEAGRLIGVCNLADPTDREGIYAALESLHWQLAKVGLERLVTEPQLLAEQRLPDRREGEASGGHSPAGRSSLGEFGQSVVAGQSPDQDDDSEVIVIVRPRHGRPGPSEVLTLPRMNGDWLEKLRAEASRNR